MSKINILVLPSDKTGVGKFRSVDPHVALQNQYPNEFHVDIEYEPKISDNNFWNKYQIVHIHRAIGHNYEQSVRIIEQLNKNGIITILDIDDYWNPGAEHPLFSLVKSQKIDEKICANIRAAKYAMTTTSIFADEIKKLNKNVVVFPNAIDPDETQFKEPTLPSEKLRVGWLGGSSHYHDLMLLQESFMKFDDTDRKNLQFYICGFDTRGSVTEIDRVTGQQKQRPIKPEETVWVKYEKIITSNYRGIDSNYLTFLQKYTEEEYPNIQSQPYVRVWTRPVQQYAKNYSKFDVSLAPIKNNMFNRMKSQLKVIEAGFYKKALIASNVGPYTLDLKHALVDGKFSDGNALLVDEKRNHSEWHKYIKKLKENPTFVQDLGERLYETVKDKYNLKNVTEERASFYRSIVK